jgi:hypothetical protein
VPQEVADQRRRRLRRTARDRGRTPSAARRAWCAWTILGTNVPWSWAGQGKQGVDGVRTRMRWRMRLSSTTPLSRRSALP